MFVPRATRHIPVAVTAFLAALILGCPMLCKGQVGGDSLSRHTIYAEGFGNAYIASLNYEYAPTPAYRVRIGVSPCRRMTGGCFSELSWRKRGKLTVLASRFFRHDVHTPDGLEVGVGMTLQRMGFPHRSRLNMEVAPTGVVGDRYQPAAGGPVFRIGWTPIYYEERRMILRRGGLSVGYAF